MWNGAKLCKDVWYALRATVLFCEKDVRMCVMLYEDGK